MIFATGFVLTALAVTTADAGNPTYLRSTSLDISSQDDSANSPTSQKYDDEKDITLDMVQFLSDSGSLDGSQDAVDAMTLIGRSDDPIQANKDDASTSLDHELLWLFGGKAKETPVKKDTEATSTEGSMTYPSWLEEDDTASMTTKQSFQDLWLYGSDSTSGSDDPFSSKGAKGSGSFHSDIKVLQALGDVFDYSETKRASKFEDSGNENDDVSKSGLDTSSTPLTDPTKLDTTIDSTIEEYWKTSADGEPNDADTQVGKSPVSKEKAPETESDSDATQSTGDELQLAPPSNDDDHLHYKPGKAIAFDLEN